MLVRTRSLAGLALDDPAVPITTEQARAIERDVHGGAGYIGSYTIRKLFWDTLPEACSKHAADCRDLLPDSRCIEEWLRLRDWTVTETGVFERAGEVTTREVSGTLFHAASLCGGDAAEWPGGIVKQSAPAGVLGIPSLGSKALQIVAAMAAAGGLYLALKLRR